MGDFPPVRALQCAAWLCLGLRRPDLTCSPLLLPPLCIGVLGAAVRGSQPFLSAVSLPLLTALTCSGGSPGLFWAAFRPSRQCHIAVEVHPPKGDTWGV